MAYVERDAYAAACIMARMEEEALGRAPIYDDLTTFDGRPWCGLVDLVAGGTPCPEFSLANPQRKRTPEEQLTTERGSLFRHHLRVAVECEAPLVFWENVAGAAGVVPLIAAALHAASYTRIVWTVLHASDVGTPHRRARIFLLAYSEELQRRQVGEPHGSRLERGTGVDGGGHPVWTAEPMADSESFGQREPDHQKCPEPRRGARGSAGGGGVRLDAGQPLAHGEGNGRDARRPESAQERWGSHASERGDSVGNAEPLGHASGSGLEGRGGISGDAGAQQQTAERAGSRVDTREPILKNEVDAAAEPWVGGAHGSDRSSGPHALGPYPPGRLDFEQWARVLEVRPDLAPALPQPRVRRVAHELARGLDSALRSDRLRLTGNGVVRAQVAHAWRGLWDHLFGEWT